MDFIQVPDLMGGRWECVAASIADLETVGARLTATGARPDLQLASMVSIVLKSPLSPILRCLQKEQCRTAAAIYDHSSHGGPVGLWWRDKVDAGACTESTAGVDHLTGHWLTL